MSSTLSQYNETRLVFRKKLIRSFPDRTSPEHENLSSASCSGKYFWPSPLVCCPAFLRDCVKQVKIFFGRPVFVCPAASPPPYLV